MQLSNFDNESQEVLQNKKKMNTKMNNSNEEDISDQTGVDKILFEYPPSSSSSAIQSSSYSFDDLLSELGFGKYQIVIFVLMGLIGMADAAESQVLSILQPILSDNWGLHTYQESLLISVVFVGYFIGSFFSGKISDRKGRRKPLQYGAVVLFISALASSFSPDFILFLSFRSIFGGCIGFIVPISFSVLAESTPVKQRGIVLALIGMFYTLGEMFVCLLSFLTLDNLKTGNWRLLLVLSTIPSFMIMIGAAIWLDESPRFLLLNKNYDEAFDVINKMIIASKNTQIQLDSSKKALIIIWAEETRDQMKHFTQGTTKALFQGEFRKITPIIWYNWFVSSLVYFGITFILPLTLTAISGKDSSDDDNDDLLSIFISAVGELPAIAVCAIIVNVPFLGRKNSWALSFLGGFIGCLFIFFELGSFTFWVTFSKLSLDLAFTLSYEYTGEVYPTKIRAEGVGMAGSFSRIGSILMPWVGNYIGNIGIFLPYLIFGIFSGAASVFTFFLPFDTRGKKLDTVQNTNLTSGAKYV